METESSQSAILVIAKHDEDKNIAHFLAFTDDEGEAIRMAQEHLWPGTHVIGRGQQGGGTPRYNQFTVKRVWECQPLPNKRLFVL